MAIAVQPRGRRYAERGPVGHVESHRRRQIVRCVMQAKAVAVAQAAVKFCSHRKVFPAESASIRTCRQG